MTLLPTRILFALSIGWCASTTIAQSWAAQSAHVPLAAAAWDPVRSQLLFAGMDSQPQQRFYAWDGTAARERLEGLLGERVVQHLLTDRPGRQVLALAEDRWVGSWSGGGWAWRNGGTAPPAGTKSVAYDEHRQRLVVVTGSDSVYEWDGTQWWSIGNTPLGLSVAGAAFAYDPRSRRCVLYGSASGSAAATWTWDGFAWTQLAANSPPGLRGLVGLAYDPVQHQRLVLYGGSATATDTWAFDGSGWNLLSSDPSPGPLETCILVGGDQGPVLLATSGTSAGAVWRLQGQQWQLQGRMPLRQHAAVEPLAVDPVRNTLVAFGGFGVFDRSWLPVAPAHRPPSRPQGHLAFAAAGQHMVAFGGIGTPSTLGDTWLWDGVDWRQHTTGPSPAPRYRGAMTEGPNGTVVLFGGVDGATYFQDTWLWNGSGWQQQNPAVAPAPRAYSLAAYDPVRTEVVLWGGYSTTATYQDQTWTWNGATWHLSALPAPVAFGTSSCFFHPELGAVLAVGSSGNWEWTGTTWLQHPGYGPVAPRAVIYHPRRRQVVEITAGLLGPSVRTLAGVRSDVTAYGPACALGPAPALAVVGVPRADSIVDLELTTRAALAPAFLVTGLTTQNQPIGGSCRALVGTTIGVHFGLADAGGILRLPIAIPDDPALRGVQFAAQGAAFVPNQSPLGSVTTSAGILLTLGD